MLHFKLLPNLEIWDSQWAQIGSKSLTRVSWISTHLTSDINKQQYFFRLVYELILGKKVKTFLKKRYITSIAFSIYNAGHSIIKEKLKRSDIIFPSYGWVDYDPIFFVNLRIQSVNTYTKTIFCLKCKSAQILCAISLLNSYLTLLNKLVILTSLALIRNFTILMGNYKSQTILTHRKELSF